MRKLTFTLVFIAGAIAVGAGFVGLANAQSMPSNAASGTGVRVYGAGHVQIQPGIFGKVSAISGTTISLTSLRSSSTIYTVDAANATVMKNGTSSSVADIAVGDFVVVQGTVSGDSVAATKISDGFVPGMGRGPGGIMGGAPGMRYGSSTRPRPMNASGTRGFGPGARPSGTLPFASGTFQGYHNFPSSTASSTGGGHLAHFGFFASIGSFFGSLFGHFKL